MHCCPRCGDGPWYMRYCGDKPVNEPVMDEFCDFVRLAKCVKFWMILLAVALATFVSVTLALR